MTLFIRFRSTSLILLDIVDLIIGQLQVIIEKCRNFATLVCFIIYFIIALLLQTRELRDVMYYIKIGFTGSLPCMLLTK